MPKSNLKLNLAGFRKLRTSATMDDLTFRMAERGAASYAGLVAKRSPGKNRARAVIVPGDAETAIEVQRDPSIMLRALAAARR